MRKKSKILRLIYIIVTAVLYTFTVGLLIFESCLPGTQSAQQSAAVGTGIANIVNETGGDTAVTVKPKSISIENGDEINACIGEKIDLISTILPEDSTYQSKVYSSSDNSVATVDTSGHVSCNKEGDVTISVHVESFIDIKDSVLIHILPVPLESVETKVYSSKGELIPDGDSVYSMTMGQSYHFENTFVPENATDKTVTYEISSDNYAYLSNNYIYPTAVSDDDTFTVTVVTPISSNIFTFKVQAAPVVVEDVIELTAIAFPSTDYTISLGESINLSSNAKFKLSFTPSNATYKSVKYTIDDPNIATLSGSTLKGKTAGTTTIHATSTYYPGITASKVINVAQINLNSIGNVTLNGSTNARLLVGNSATVRYSSYSPTNATCIVNKYISYSSSQPSIATVSSGGLVKGLADGNTVITVKFFNTSADKAADNPAFTKTINVTVFTSTVVDFKLVSSLDEGGSSSVKTLYANKEYKDFSKKFSITALYDSDGKTIPDSMGITKDCSLSYIEADHVEFAYTYESDKLNISDVSGGALTVYITHTDTGLQKSMTFYVLPEYEVSVSVDDDSKPLNSDLSLLNVQSNIYVGSTLSFSINIAESERLSFKSNIVNNPTYFEYVNDNTILATRSISLDKLRIVPTLLIGEDVIEFAGFSYTVNITVLDKLVENFDILVYSNNKKQNLESVGIDSEIGAIMYDVEVDDIISLSFIYYPWARPTAYALEIVSDSREVYLDNGTIKFSGVGNGLVKIRETISNTEKYIYFDIFNRVALNEESAFSITQTHAVYNEKENAFHIRNGISARLKINFTADSTFKKATYTSSDESILIIGQDGVISPISAGKAVIHVVIDDGKESGKTVKYSFDINVVVDAKPVIDDLNDFLKRIRKSIGHFGAFLAFGIISSMFFMVFLDKKKWAYSIPITYIQGYTLASLTEFIQTLVPKRAGIFKDVIIDYTGFLIGASVAAVIILIVYLMRFLIKRHKTKLQNEK